MHKRCTHCGGPFGLIRQRWWGERFCSDRCRKKFLDKIAKDRERFRKWIGYLKPP
jgi:predicted nucleic acid-binding Zn ribbon protein